MLRKSDVISELAVSLCKAQAEMKHATKDSVNPHFKSKYADLTNILSVVKDVLPKYGLCVVQGLSSDVDKTTITVETMIMHVSGQWISDDFTLKPTKTDPQGYGSAVTYARRYSLAAMLGIGQEDDDGNAASSKDDPPPPPAKKSTIYTGVEHQRQILIDICTKKGLSDEQFEMVESQMMNQPSTKLYEIIEKVQQGLT